MAMNIEGYGALAPASVRQRQQTDARQDRWMSELEHAMLQSAKKPVSPAAKHQQPAAPPPAPLPESPLDGAGPDAAVAAAAVTASAPLAPAAVAPPGSEPAAAAASNQPGAGAAAAA
ncbi:hypothetical protein GTP58_28140, partial [Duganella sp. CY15W]|nr:hypothetical protein [Duganella sp. CY15W]